MSKKPALILSSLDVERLEALLEKTPNTALEEELDRARVVEPAKMPADRVTMNSTVCFRLAGGDSFCKTLVYPKDASKPDSISVMAPVGSALLGLKTGSSIDWPGPDGKTVSVTIESIAYQPEQAGDLHR
ncbi:MAG TPA: nucleoside diphosphate kinase regulator [Pseudomonadales bacterium]